MHIYSAAIKDWDLNMDNVMRTSLTQNRKQPEDYAGELSGLFGVSKPSWDSIADYASFLASLYDSADASVQAPHAKDNYELITDQIVKQMDIVDGEDLLRSQSVYEKIKHGKYQIGHVADRHKDIRQELKEFAKLERRLMAQRVARENVEALAETAPKDVKDIVTRVLSSQSQYLNLEEIEKILQAKDYAKLRTPEGFSQIIDKDRIF